MSASLTTAVLGLAALSGAAASPVEYAHPGVPAHSWALAEEVPAPSTKIVLTVAVRQSEQGKQKLREEILARFERIEVQEEPTRTFSSFVKGYTRLPVVATRK